jgi:protein-S-isoprenylcysteine O-methyltransferase Ste14
MRLPVNWMPLNFYYITGTAVLGRFCKKLRVFFHILLGFHRKSTLFFLRHGVPLALEIIFQYAEGRTLKGGNGMKKGLMAEAVLKFGLGIILVTALVFLPAGTLRFPHGWLFMAVLFLPMLAAGIVLLMKRPQLLEQRLKQKEQQREQSLVVKLSALMFLAGFIMAGLDCRFGWSELPRWVNWLGAGLFLLSYLLYAEVMRENAYLSRTVEVQEGQKVVDTGLYGIVRHPMYAATVLMFCSMPLILGSLPAFEIFLLYPFLLVVRIRDEEELLVQELEGYRDYQKKVRYKMIPFIW